MNATNATTTTTPILRPLTKNDRAGFAGCEDFDVARIAHTDHFVALVDAERRGGPQLTLTFFVADDGTDRPQPIFVRHIRDMDIATELLARFTVACERGDSFEHTAAVFGFDQVN